MKKSKYIILLSTLFSSVSCSSNIDYTLSNKYDDILSKFKLGFEVTGTLTSTKKYYEDKDYKIPLENKSDIIETYQIHSIYQNSSNYTGVDRRYYKLGDNNVKKYLSGENAYDNNGYVGLNYIDYNNNYQTDGYSSDDDYNESSYGSSGLLNPFLLINSDDISDNNLLSIDKSNLLFSSLFAGISDKLITEIPMKKGEFSSDFSKIHIVSNNYQTIEYVDYQNYYDVVTYDISLTFTQVGTSNSKDALKVEPHKEENDVLQVALNNMVNKPLDIYRKIVSYDNGKKIDAEETIVTYNNGTDIYMQVFDSDLSDDKIPTSPTASDLYLKANKGKTLNTYTYDKDGENNDFIFTLDTQNYISINGYYTYDAFQPDFAISADIFNKNEDGSFSPTEDNLPYIAGDCFVPALNTTSEIAYGQISDLKIYLSDDKTYICNIDIEFDSTAYQGNIYIKYFDVGKGSIPFNITIE